MNKHSILLDKIRNLSLEELVHAWVEAKTGSAEIDLSNYDLSIWDLEEALRETINNHNAKNLTRNIDFNEDSKDS